jgi:hypothetical protein
VHLAAQLGSYLVERRAASLDEKWAEYSVALKDAKKAG